MKRRSGVLRLMPAQAVVKPTKTPYYKIDTDCLELAVAGGGGNDMDPNDGKDTDPNDGKDTDPNDGNGIDPNDGNGVDPNDGNEEGGPRSTSGSTSRVIFCSGPLLAALLVIFMSCQSGE